MSYITEGWFEMPYNYNERKVGLYKKDGLIISTAYVTDGDLPYETAVEHPEYGAPTMVIVEAYSDKEAASKGHEKWIKKMTSDRLPSKLIDCLNSRIAQILYKGDRDGRVFKRKKPHRN